MQPNEYCRPDDRGLLRAAIRELAQQFRPAVLFGGMVSGKNLQLSDFLGTKTAALRNVSVPSGTGLGGRVVGRRQPCLVSDYIGSDRITHEYDGAVTNEGIRSLTAVPVLVQGEPRSVLYVGSREGIPLGERAMNGAMAVAAAIASELRIRDEVDRRVSVMNHVHAEPALAYDLNWLDEVRQAHAELRSLASIVKDVQLAQQLDGIGARLAPSPAGNMESPVRLAPRELDVLAQIALGCSYAETADRLSLKPVTVKSYLQNAMAKLSVHNRLEAVSAARRLGLLP
ncbi:helix-turn-helix transcriptional regulator [Paenarthrobacter nitroguajacolicus]|uniref:helix-turn-helix transcriptional regulator n=1 Tax=Paenarthrobacter nitroguajacolicus TaxID=211146 RepID=UPI00248C892A|nr:LuxR C-terminal-related transcriptional regulator [Paenarthrobacter nitroguajacolicus]MDI2035586.1 HTH-type transcriptional activator RamA [Paenarthrobacter nitroguajacolicus]